MTRLTLYNFVDFERNPALVPQLLTYLARGITFDDAFFLTAGLVQRLVFKGTYVKRRKSYS